MTNPLGYRETINLGPWLNNNRLDFTTKRDRIVDAIRRSDWYIDAPHYGILHQIVDDLEFSTNRDELEETLDELKTLADEDAIRILER